MLAIGSVSSVSSDVVNGGTQRAVGSWPGIRTAVNARLEEVSFRTGVTAGAVTLLVLAAATAAVVLTVMPSQGSPANRAAAAPAAASAPVAAAVTPAAAPTPRTPGRQPVEASAPPSAPPAGTRPAAQAGQTSPDTGSSPQEAAAGGNPGPRAGWQAGHGGHWHGRRTRAWAPRSGRIRAFTGALWRPAPPGRVGLIRP
jgi:hypothetical protein